VVANAGTLSGRACLVIMMANAIASGALQRRLKLDRCRSRRPQRAPDATLGDRLGPLRLADRSGMPMPHVEIWAACPAIGRAASPGSDYPSPCWG